MSDLGVGIQVALPSLFHGASVPWDVDEEYQENDYLDFRSTHSRFAVDSLRAF